MEKIFRLGQSIVKWISCLFVGFLALTGLVLYVEDLTWFEFFKIKINLLYTLGSLVCFILLFVGVIKLINLKPKWKWKQIGFLFCTLSAISVLLTSPSPNWDQLWISVETLKLKGDIENYNSIIQMYLSEGFDLESYLLICPNLINNILFQNLFTNYVFFYLYNIVIYLFTYAIGLKIVDEQNQKYFGTLFCLCAPLAMYTCFYYGEITMIFGMTLSIYLIKQMFNQDKISIKYLIILFIINFIMYLEKENSLIFIIAEILCLILFLFKKKQNKIIVAVSLIAIIISTLLVSPISNLWANKVGLYKGYSNPLSFIAMGMHDNTFDDYSYLQITNIEGGYDNTNHVFVNSDEELDEVKQNNIKDIKSSLDNFKSNPSYAVKFYFNKIVKQWNTNDFNASHFIRLNNPKVISYINNAIENNEQYAFIKPPYKENYDYIRDFLCNGERMYVYLVAFVLCVDLIKKRKKLSYIQTLCLVMFIGNFLFSIIWEAKPRYCIYGYYTLIIFVATSFSIFQKIPQEALKNRQH